MKRFDRNSEHNKKYGNRFYVSRYKYLLYALFLIRDMCCDASKKRQVKTYEKSEKRNPIMGTMAEESDMRLTKWLIHGCNAFDLKRPQSHPMSFWTEQDVLTYIHTYNLDIADAYGQVVVKNDGINVQINIHEYLGDYRDCQYETTGCKRTGCVFCLFGIRQDLDRMIRLSEQEPKLCDYVMRGGEFSDSGMWQPSKDGLGYWFVLEWLNVHGNLNIGIPNRKYYIDKYGTEMTRKFLN